MSNEKNLPENSMTTSGATILALDASGENVSVALWQDQSLVGTKIHHARHGHAATLVPMIEALLGTHSIDYAGLTHIAAGRGPGSFTGIRVALATAKGLCIATNAIGAGVSVLAASAAAVAARNRGQGLPILALADTRRGSFYGQIFTPGGDEMTAIFEADGAEIQSHIPPEVTALTVIGTQARAVGDMIADKDVNLLDDEDSLAFADAGQIAALVESRIRMGIKQEPLTPLYLAPAFLGPGKS